MRQGSKQHANLHSYILTPMKVGNIHTYYVNVAQLLLLSYSIASRLYQNKSQIGSDFIYSTVAMRGLAMIGKISTLKYLKAST